jgi:hypothetical protein
MMPVAVVLRGRFTVARTSPENLPAPRGEPVDPFRSRDPMIIGAALGVETMPIKAFSPRTPE